MNADVACDMVNAELVRQGHPLVVLTDAQKNMAYSRLLEYAHQSGRSLEVAVKDVVRFQLQGEQLEEARSMS